MDYFTLSREQFLEQWLPGRDKDISRQTTPASWRAIVESLNNPVQQRIVADDREHTNVLVLAGPGSGKTRVLVHRIAYLVRVRRESPRGILALAYNRHAAVEIRRRLADLIGDDAKGVTVMTCHALAMRLVGVSFRNRAAKMDDDSFRAVLQDAAALLKGIGLPPEEADEQRERVLAGFRWILVDEYQDIGADQYELISALAGRTQHDEDGRLSLFAVGDDDQNLYAFAGASVEFIRRFEEDYKAKPDFLTENYRSTSNIINVSNLVIGFASKRMKAEHPIVIDRTRAKAAAGGEWESIDPVGRGRVQILAASYSGAIQAMAAMAELHRLSTLTSGWNWAEVAVIAREWEFLQPVRSYCEINSIPVQMADERAPNFWRLRETQALVEWLRGRQSNLVDAAAIKPWFDVQPAGPWIELLREAVDYYAQETDGAELPTAHFFDWLAEWGQEVRRKQSGLMLLTAHRAKGLEFNHVVVLDGGWSRVGKGEDEDASRRLYYVAMTRAKKTLTLARLSGRHPILDELPQNSGILRRASTVLPQPAPELSRHYKRLALGDVNLGFAGAYASDHKVHQAIANLKSNDVIDLRQIQSRWQLVNKTGIQVGQLANSFKPPWGMTCIDASVAAIIERRREDEKPEYIGRVRCDCWEVVVPDLVFAPAN